MIRAQVRCSGFNCGVMFIAKHATAEEEALAWARRHNEAQGPDHVLIVSTRHKSQRREHKVTRTAGSTSAGVTTGPWHGKV